MRTNSSGYSHLVVILLLGLFTVMSLGCKARTCRLSPSTPLPVTAVYADEPITVDGKLNESIWQTAPHYELQLGADRTLTGDAFLEKGSVQCAYDTNYFYLAVDFQDTDVVAEGQKDQLHHYQFGDVAELFLKPENATWYWEMYVTPRSNKTVFFFPSRGRLGLPSDFNDQGWGVQVGATVKGTLNDWKDKDKGWTAEMAVPIADLTRFGDVFGCGSKWRILISRYNYSRYLSNVELTSLPRLSKTDFHFIEEYAVLTLRQPKYK